jgi:hypothetical protein
MKILKCLGLQGKAFLEKTSIAGDVLSAVRDKAISLKDGYQRLTADVIKRSDSKEYLVSLAKAQRREGKWTEAAATFEAAGETYSAMFCLHAALERGQGNASDHFRKLSQLYHKVGRHERAKRYGGYSDHARLHENVAIANSYCRDCKKKIDVKKLTGDFGEAMYDDKATFLNNLKIYVHGENSRVADGHI